MVENLGPVLLLQTVQGELEGPVDVGAAAEAVLQEGEQLQQRGRVHLQLNLLHVARPREGVQVARALLPVRAPHALQRHRLREISL